MNTPKTKKPKRWQHLADRPGSQRHTRPSGSYTIGLADPDYLLRVGSIATLWPHIEVRMGDLFQELLGASFGGQPVTAVFRSIVNAKLRITVLRNLLQGTAYNMERGPEYDDVIDEFAALNGLRNDYVHGLWSVSMETGTVYLSELALDGVAFAEARRVPLSDLDAVLGRMDRLNRKIIEVVAHARVSHMRQPQSPQTPPKRPDESAPKAHRARRSGNAKPQ